MALTGAQIGGIVIGTSSAFLSLVFLVCLWFIRRRRLTRRDNDVETFPEVPSSGYPGVPPPTYYAPSSFGGSTLFNSQQQPSQSPYSAYASTPSTYVASPSPAVSPQQYAQSSSSTPGQPLLKQVHRTDSGADSGAAKALPIPISTEEILGTDKRSQLQDVQVASSRSSQDLTVALGRTAFQPDKLGAIDETRVVNPWEVEKQPNRVHFPHLYMGESSSTANETRVVNPWEVEKQPNPVHFPHLYMGESSSTANETLKKNEKNDSSSSGELGRQIGAGANAGIDFERHTDAFCESLYPNLSRHDSSTRSSGPVSTISPSIGTNSDTEMTEPDTPMTVHSSLASGSPRKESHQIIAEENQTSEQNDHDVIIEGAFNLDDHTNDQQIGPNMVLQINAVSIPDYPEAFRHAKFDVPSPAPEGKPQSDSSTQSLSPTSSSNQTPSVDPQLTSTTTSPSSPSFPCPHCTLPLSTQGKLNDHINRKHTRRFPCPHCAEKFHLRADLTRHKITVHREQHAPEKTYRCPNEGCGKEWGRKDHAKRHAGRCKVGKRAEGG